MISFHEAYALVMASRPPALPTESVPLCQALGRVLAEDILSDIDMPPFEKSAMDGYACRRVDLSREELEIIEEVPAGVWPTHPLRPGTCARVLTGAPIPSGADCVVMQEQAVREGRMLRLSSTKTADNICRKGEDLRAGELVVGAGTRVNPAIVAMLASVGATVPTVSRRPRITILSTGNEVVEPELRPGPAQIRNSNGPQLMSQALAMGAVPSYGGIVRDEQAALIEAIGRAALESDVLLLSGGVSTGDLDFVPRILEGLGFSLEFDSVAMQPGRPTVFARRGSLACFGLPGSPVASFVVFELLVKPFLYRLMGHDFVPLMVEARLATAVNRKHTQRQSTIPVSFVAPDEVRPIEYHGSAHIQAMCHADGLLTVPTGVSGFEKGDAVRVRSLSS